MDFMIMTNNPEIAKSYQDFNVYCVEGTVLQLFFNVRDLIHKGHRLLMHPLSGSLKPGTMPYKTIVLTSGKAQLDLESLYYIENSIEAYHKTKTDLSGINDQEILLDYAMVDLSHLQAFLESGIVLS
jgi:hypothetical protein